MMVCPECGATLPDGVTCETEFHQMLFWEGENPANWAVHHLTVLCYHLQHPHLYSSDGLAGGLQLLTTFVRDGISPAEVRRTSRDKVNSKNRNWKITARPDSKGAYAHPPTWTIRTVDVVVRGSDRYCDSVREWAQSVYDSIKDAGNSTATS
ncbi:MAG: hypothetical protein H0X30_06660 [Anaerolineae bacterium]|nr:hypothetical protein [Anaerolineae bacterium]